MKFRWLIVALLCLAAPASAFWQSRDSNYNQSIASSGSPMVTPILAYNMGGGTAPLNSTVSYVPFLGGYNNGGASITTTATGRVQVMPIGGSISNLFASFPQGIGSGTWQAALTKNGSSSASALTCTVSSGTTCSDTSDSVSFAAGDTLSWQLTPASTPTAITSFQLGATLTSTNNNEGFLGSRINSAPSTAAQNYGPLNGFGAWGTTEANVSSLVAANGVIDQLYAITSAAPNGASKSYTATVYHNGNPTSITCTITNAETTCSDTNAAHAETIAAGDTISISVTPANTPTAGTMSFGVRWVPTTTGQSLLSANDQDTMPTTSVTNYIQANGNGAAGGTEAARLGVAGSSFTIKNLYVAISPDAGATHTRTVTLRAGNGTQSNAGTPAALSCTLIGGTNTTCSDLVNTYGATSGTFINFATTVVGTNNALTYFKTSAVMTVP